MMIDDLAIGAISKGRVNKWGQSLNASALRIFKEHFHMLIPKITALLYFPLIAPFGKEDI
ncbi:MAG: hypothetical protein GY850_06450 [bacterium]|nr:hypothetical protein [bacterium]